MGTGIVHGDREGTWGQEEYMETESTWEQEEYMGIWRLHGDRESTWGH